MSLLSLDLTAIIISDLNAEIRFKLNDTDSCYADFSEDLLSLQTDGNEHTILFLGSAIFDTKLEKMYESIPPRVQIDLNEREKFEPHLRILINDRINILKHLEL